jgi:uncharacterized membrane-anchored protein YhcB (DUF1043 family)
MPRRTGAAAFLAAVFLFVACTAWAEPRESLDTIRARFERQRQEVSEKLRTQKVELMKLMALDNPNAEHIKKKLSQILETEEERQYLFVDEMFAVRNAMTAQEWRDYRRSIIFMMMDKKSR